MTSEQLKRRKSDEKTDINDEDIFIIPSNTTMGNLCRQIDWSETLLGKCLRRYKIQHSGPTSTWPQSLRTATAICLTNRFPTYSFRNSLTLIFLRLIFWGPSAVQIYNDGYIQVLGSRHYSQKFGALGKSGRGLFKK